MGEDRCPVAYDHDPENPESTGCAVCGWEPEPGSGTGGVAPTRDDVVEAITARTGKNREQAEAFLDLAGSAFRRRGWAEGEPLSREQISERLDTFLGEWVGWRCTRCGHEMRNNPRWCPRCEYTVYEPVKARERPEWATPSTDHVRD